MAEPGSAMSRLKLEPSNGELAHASFALALEMVASLKMGRMETLRYRLLNRHLAQNRGASVLGFQKLQSNLHLRHHSSDVARALVKLCHYRGAG